MKKIKSIILGALFFGAALTLGISASLAQESIPGQTSVATVDVREAGFLSQEGSALEVAFTLSNKENFQPGIKYGVELISNSGGMLADQVVFPEAVSLKAGAAIKKTASYVPPGYLKGNFQVWVKSRTESGLLLGQALAGKINLDGDGRFVEISNCSLAVSGNKMPYRSDRGADISLEERLTLSCDAKNQGDSEIAVIPQIKISLRSAFGKIVSEEYGSAVQIEKGAVQKLDLAVPKTEFPQAYEATIFLIDSATGEKVSAPVVARYVLRGESATIQNATLDRDDHKKGKIATANLFWTGRADNFPGARQTMEGISQKTILKIGASGADGQSCADDFSRELDPANPIEKAEIAFTDDCRDGKITVVLADGGGNVLDERTIEFQKQEIGLAPGDKKSALPLPYFLGGILFLVGLMAVIAKKKNIASSGALFLLMIGFLAVVNGARADTFIGLPVEGYYPIFAVSLDKDSYCKGENIAATGTIQSWGCYAGAGKFETYATINGPTQSLGFMTFNGDGNDRCDSGSVTPITKNFTAQSSAGNFDAYFIGKQCYESGSTVCANNYHNTGYSVADCDPPPPPIDGACGSSQGKTFETAPTENLCASGNRSKPVLNSSKMRWVWTCSGSNGGDSAGCWANAVSDGKCGPANGRNYVPAPPVTERCLFGTQINFSQDADGFYWDCAGINGGKRDSCEAVRPDPKVSFTFSDGTVAPKTRKLGNGVSFRWIPTGATWCWGWSNSLNNDGNWTVLSDGRPGGDWKTPPPANQQVFPQSSGSYKYWIKCGNGSWKESGVKELDLEMIEECSADQDKNECFRIDNCAGQECRSALQTVYCVDECGNNVEIVDGKCGKKICVPERITCPCYDGNWKEVQP